MFFWNSSCFFDDPSDIGNLISGSPEFSKTSLNIWKVTVHALLKLGLENFKHYFTSMWDEWNCAVVWAFFGIAFLCDWNENWRFPVLWLLLSFLNLLAYWDLIFNYWVGKFSWKRKWQPNPVFFPGEFHGQRSLASYSPRGLKELDMTEWLTLSLSFALGVQ